MPYAYLTSLGNITAGVEVGVDSPSSAGHIIYALIAAGFRTFKDRS